MMDTIETVGWEVFARIRVELMAMGEDERLIAEANALNYTGLGNEESREG